MVTQLLAWPFFFHSLSPYTTNPDLPSMCIDNTCPQWCVGFAFLHPNQPLSTIPDSYNTMFPISTTTKFLSLTMSHLFQFQLDSGLYKPCYAIINPNRFKNAFQAICNAFNETKGSFRLSFFFFGMFMVPPSYFTLNMRLNHCVHIQ